MNHPHSAVHKDLDKNHTQTSDKGTNDDDIGNTHAHKHTHRHDLPRDGSYMKTRDSDVRFETWLLV